MESGRYDTRDDFTVVMQPFLTNVKMPKTQVKTTKINVPALNPDAIPPTLQNCLGCKCDHQFSGLIIITFS